VRAPARRWKRESRLETILRLQARVKYWSNTGQILVKYWKLSDQCWSAGEQSNTGQTLTKHWSNTRARLVDRWSMLTEDWPGARQMLVK
jgi:hypothetical protein